MTPSWQGSGYRPILRGPLRPNNACLSFGTASPKRNVNRMRYWGMGHKGLRSEPTVFCSTTWSFKLSPGRRTFLRPRIHPVIGKETYLYLELKTPCQSFQITEMVVKAKTGKTPWVSSNRKWVKEQNEFLSIQQCLE